MGSVEARAKISYCFEVSDRKRSSVKRLACQAEIRLANGLSNRASTVLCKYTACRLSIWWIFGQRYTLQICKSALVLIDFRFVGICKQYAC